VQMDKQWYTCQEVAKLENIPLRTVQSRCAKGRYSCIKDGRDWKIHKVKYDKLKYDKLNRIDKSHIVLNNSTNNILVFTNSKGGVGKTTLSVLFADICASLGYKVLLVDNNGQGNSTTISDLMPFVGNGKPAKNQYTYGMHDVYLSQIYKQIGHKPPIETNQVIFKAPKREYFVLPSDYRLYQVKFWLLDNAHAFPSTKQLQTLWKMHFPYLLKYALEEIRDQFDFIIIDTPSSLDFETKNALMAGTDVIIPIELGLFEILGLRKVMMFIEECAKDNSALGVLGVVISRYGPTAANLDKDLETAIRADPEIKNLVFETVIMKSLHIREATIEKQPFDKYWRSGLPKKVLDIYHDFTEELLLRVLRKRRLKK